MTANDSLRRVVGVIAGAALLAAMLVPALYLQMTVLEAFKEPRESLLLTLGLAFVCLAQAEQMLAGKALFSAGAGSWARRVFFALGVWALLASFWAYDPVAARWHAVAVVSVLLIGQSVMDWVSLSARRASVVLSFLALLVGAEALVGLAQLLRLPLGTWAAGIPVVGLPGGFWPHDFLTIVGMPASDGRPAGTFGNENYLAELFALALPLLGGWLAGVRSKFSWAGWVTLVAAFVVFAGTGTRAALLGLIVGATVAAGLVLWPHRADWSARMRDGRQKLLAAGVLGGGLVLVGLAIARIATKLSTGNVANLAVQSRLENWKAALSVWLSSPLVGHGLGSFKLLQEGALAKTFPGGLPTIVGQERFIAAHNEPLQLLVELGLVGLVLGLAALGAWLYEAHANGTLSRATRFGLIGGVLALLVASCFGFPLHVPVTALAVVVVLALGMTRPAPETAAAPTSARVVVAATLAVLVGLAGLAIQRVATPLFDANRYSYVAYALQSTKKLPEEAVVLALVERQARFKGEVRSQRIENLLSQKQYQQALDLYQASDRIGLKTADRLLEARALYGLNRKVEARKVCDELSAYFPADTETHKLATRYIEQMEHEKKVIARVGD